MLYYCNGSMELVFLFVWIQCLCLRYHMMIKEIKELLSYLYHWRRKRCSLLGVNEPPMVKARTLNLCLLVNLSLTWSTWFWKNVGQCWMSCHGTVQENLVNPRKWELWALLWRLFPLHDYSINYIKFILVIFFHILKNITNVIKSNEFDFIFLIHTIIKN